MFFSLDGEKDCALLQKPLVITDIATCARLMLLIKIFDGGHKECNYKFGTGVRSEEKSRRRKADVETLN